MPPVCGAPVLLRPAVACATPGPCSRPPYSRSSPRPSRLPPCRPLPSPTLPRPLSRALPRHPTLTHLASKASPTPVASPFALPRAVEMARCSPARESCPASDLRICIKVEKVVRSRLHAPCHFDGSRRIGRTTGKDGRWLSQDIATAFSHQPPSLLHSQTTYPESSNPRLSEILRNAA